jgi:hypothetical protein
MEVGLEPHLSWNDISLGSTTVGFAVQVAYERRFGLGKHSTVEELGKICGSAILKYYYVFALVRHPLHRVCSLYNFIARVVDRWAAELGVAPENLAQRVAENPDLPEKIPALAWSATVAFLQTAGFSEFLRNEHAKRDMAYSSQVSRPLGAETYKLEDMKENLPALGRKLGFDFDFPHLNRRGRVFVTPDAVSSEDRSYIEKLYAEDYAALGY